MSIASGAKILKDINVIILFHYYYSWERDEIPNKPNSFPGQ